MTNADIERMPYTLNAQQAVEAFNKAFLGNDPGSSQIPVGAQFQGSKSTKKS